MRQTWEALAQDHVAVNGILSLHAQLEALESRLAGVEKGEPIVAAAKALDGKILAVEEKLYQPKSEADEEQLNYPVELNSQLAYLQTVIDSADAAPTKQSVEVFGRLRRRLDAQLAAWKMLQEKDLAALNNDMRKAGIAALAPAPGASTTLTSGGR